MTHYRVKGVGSHKSLTHEEYEKTLWPSDPKELNGKRKRNASIGTFGRNFLTKMISSVMQNFPLLADWYDRSNLK